MKMRCFIAALLCVSSFAQEITVQHLVLPLGGSGVIEFKGGETRVLGSIVVTNALGSEGCSNATDAGILVDIVQADFDGELRLPFGGDNASLFLGCSPPNPSQINFTTPSCPVNLTIAVTSWSLNPQDYKQLNSDIVELNNEGSVISTETPVPYFYIVSGSFVLHSLGNCELPLNFAGGLIPNKENLTKNMTFTADSNHTNTNVVGKLFHPFPLGNTVYSFVKLQDQNCTAEVSVELLTYRVDLTATDAPKTETPWTDLPPFVPFTPTPDPTSSGQYDLLYIAAAVAGVSGIVILVWWVLKQRKQNARMRAFQVNGEGTPLRA